MKVVKSVFILFRNDALDPSSQTLENIRIQIDDRDLNGASGFIWTKTAGDPSGDSFGSGFYEVDLTTDSLVIKILYLGNAARTVALSAIHLYGSENMLKTALKSQFTPSLDSSSAFIDQQNPSKSFLQDADDLDSCIKIDPGSESVFTLDSQAYLNDLLLVAEPS